MRNRRWFERAAWAFGISLMLIYGTVRAGSEIARSTAVRAFPVDKSLWSPQRKAAFVASQDAQDLPAGILRIPALRLEVPIYEGTSEINLNRGAGRIETTAALGSSGNVGIAAHRDGFFRKLKDAQVGQVLYIETQTFGLQYRITEVRVVKPTDVTVLAPTPHPTITLITCYPFYFVGSAPQRFIVRAEAYERPPTSLLMVGKGIHPYRSVN